MIVESLERAAWKQREHSHQARADALTSAHRARASQGVKHPVWDFLFTYYSYSPSPLRRWHPGARVQLEEAPERDGWRWYVSGSSPGAVVPDAEGSGSVLVTWNTPGTHEAHFGADSAAKHADAGHVTLDVPATSTLRRDVDTAEQPEAAAALGLGPRTTALLEAARAA